MTEPGAPHMDGEDVMARSCSDEAIQVHEGYLI